MLWSILLVDRDRDFLLALQNGVAGANRPLSVLTAEDGGRAVEMLARNFVSLVVADVETPGMNGFGILAHIMEHYPGTPVIVTAGRNDPELERLALEAGATGYIGKPFSAEKIVALIETALGRESDCGMLHGVSSCMFLQLMEMEQKTCTIRVFDRASGKQGVLFFRQGELLDARAVGLRAEAAAHQIFSWEEVSISIQGACSLSEKRMQRDLQAILLEAMRLKDEAETEKAPESAAPGGKALEGLSKEPGGERPNSGGSMRQQLEAEIGARGKMLDTRRDASWDTLASQAAAAGAFFKIGQLKGGYIDKGKGRCFVLLPGGRTKVMAVNSQCSRDRILQILGD